MNEVYKSETLVRDALTIDQAFDILWKGYSVEINYPPDFSAENENDIFESGIRAWLKDIIAPDDQERKTKEECKEEVCKYLHGYEIYE